VSTEPRIAICAGFGAFVTTMPSEAHRPHATKLLIPLEGTLQVDLVDEGRRIETTRPVLIAPEIKHRVPCATRRVTAFIDPETAGAMVTAHIKATSHDGSVCVDSSRGPALIESGRIASSRLEDRGAFEQLRRDCCQSPQWSPPQPALDRRIHAVVARLVTDPEHRLKLEELADVADLSARWLSKLFKEKMGTSLRRYARWLKLADSVQLACTIGGLTDSAMAAGFADLPHFSRSVSELMGSSPSLVPFTEGHVHQDYFAGYRDSPPWPTTAAEDDLPPG
jgi:AraC-like DNA-binding protein